MSTYRLLFALDIRHTYFADGRCDALHVRPTPSCERLMRQYRLLFRATYGGAEIYYDADAQRQGAPGSLLGFAAQNAFTFMLGNDAPGFTGYTAIDAKPAAVPGASLYYFDNLNGGSATFDGVASALLHPAGQPFAYGARPWEPLRFGYAAGAPLNGAFAIAAIYPGGMNAAPADAGCLDAQGNVTPRRYAIVLSAKALLWRYFIVPHPNQPHDDWQVDAVMRAATADAPAAPLRFTRAAKTVPLGGRAAVIFSSPHPLIVLQRSSVGLMVRLIGRSFAQPLTLPYPDMEQARMSMQLPVSAHAEAERPATSDTGEPADIYVYL
jgi:hypothetical protein